MSNTVRYDPGDLTNKYASRRSRVKGSKRRGYDVNARLRAQMRLTETDTEPDFESRLASDLIFGATYVRGPS